MGDQVFNIADSLNGYLLDCKVYSGSETHSASSQYSHLPKTFQIVMNLMTQNLDKGYHLYTDRFYTIVVLANELNSRSTRYTGTLNNSRKDLPDSIRGVKKNKLNLPQVLA